MASPKKRKNNAGGDENADGATDHASKRAAKRSRTSNQARKSKKPRTDNLLMKLPGELRNRIYDLVLVEYDPIIVRARKSRTVGRSVEKERRSRHRPEPGLLRVSKDIRNEASTVYYHDNKFKLIIKTNQIADACAWLLRNYNLGKSVTAMDFTIRITAGHWKDITSWLSLVKLAYYVDFGFTENEDNCFWAKAIYACNTNLYGLNDLLMGVVQLGTRARHRGCPYESAELDFENWAVSVTTARNHWDAELKAWRFREDRRSARDTGTR